MRYASQTGVPVDRSKGEIERLVIPLNHNKFTMIDASDLHVFAGRKWRAVNRDSRWYVCADGDRRGSIVYLHRLLTAAPSGKKVDHKDHDGLNNVRDNLRVCSNAENLRNRVGPNSNNTTGFIGVYKRSDGRRRFQAKIKVNGKSICLGQFDTAEEAALARDDAAVQLHKEFAYLNGKKVPSKTHVKDRLPKMLPGIGETG